MSCRLLALAAAAACGAPSRSPAPPPPAPATAGASCAPIPRPLWQDLKEVEAKPPVKPVVEHFGLPRGITLPLPARPREGDCTDVGGLGALVGKPLRVCCEPVDEWRDDGFMEGCRALFACRYEDRQGGRARTTSELARLVAPITTVEAALALVSLTYPEIIDPGAGEGYQGYPNAPPAFEILPDGSDFVVFAAAAPICGCDHSARRVAFRVSHAGCVSRVDQAPELLAYSAGECVD